jgi:hypothetical protein
MAGTRRNCGQTNGKSRYSHGKMKEIPSQFLGCLYGNRHNFTRERIKQTIATTKLEVSIPEDEAEAWTKCNFQNLRIEPGFIYLVYKYQIYSKSLSTDILH